MNPSDGVTTEKEEMVSLDLSQSDVQSGHGNLVFKRLGSLDYFNGTKAPSINQCSHWPLNHEDHSQLMGQNILGFVKCDMFPTKA